MTSREPALGGRGGDCKEVHGESDEALCGGRGVGWEGS